MKFRLAFFYTCALLLVAPAVHANDAPSSASGRQQVSALVRTELPHKTSIDRTLVGYGRVTTDVSHTQSLSVPLTGMVSALNVGVGTPVANGQPLLDFRTAPEVQAAYQQVTSAVVNAREELKRVKSQVKLQLATQSQLAAARKALSDAEAAYRAQRQLGAEHKTWTLRAPFAGVVVAVFTRQGDRVQAGAPLLQLAHTNALVAPLGIEPEDSDKVKPGMTVRLTSIFRPEQHIEGRIVQRRMAIDPQTHLVDMLARFAPPAGSSWAIGLPVRGEIVLGGQPEWTLPRSAVLTDKNGAYIYQVKNGKAHLVRVSIENESDQAVAIQGGFDSSLPVVVVGNYELHDGMVVREEKQ